MPDRHTTYQVRNGVMMPAAQGKLPSARKNQVTASREEQIRAAADAARRKDSTLPLGFAATAIASGKSVEQVKVELFDRLAGVDRQAALISMRKRCGLPPDAA